MKIGFVVTVTDLDHPTRIENIAQIFADLESVTNFSTRRLNPLVTVIVAITPILISDTFDLVKFEADQ